MILETCSKYVLISSWPTEHFLLCEELDFHDKWQSSILTKLRKNEFELKI